VYKVAAIKSQSGQRAAVAAPSDTFGGEWQVASVASVWSIIKTVTIATIAIESSLITVCACG